MYNRILKLPLDQEDSLFLFGPRGVGKTRWLKSNIKVKDGLYLDLLHYPTYTQLISDPSILEHLIPEHYKGWVIVEESFRINKYDLRMRPIYH